MNTKKVDSKPLKKPNYAYWAAVDCWTLSDAAFLLNDIDPELFENIEQQDPVVYFALIISQYPAYTELAKKVHQTYLQLKNTDWQLTPYGISLDEERHPFAFIYEAYYQNLIKLDAPLFIEVNKLYQAAEGHPLIDDVGNDVRDTQNAPFSERERDHLLTALGLLSMILAEKVSRYQKGEEPSALQIKNAICEKAEALGLEASGLESINRKIREGFELVKVKTKIK